MPAQMTCGAHGARQSSRGLLFRHFIVEDSLDIVASELRQLFR
jgi:hypothetical protein